MKIALLHYSAPPIVGGVESVLGHHARLMTNAGHQVTIFAGRGEQFDDRVPVCILPRIDSRHHEVMQVKTFLDRGELPPLFDELSQQIRQDLQVELKNFDILIAHNVLSLHKNLPLTAAIHDLYRIEGFPPLVIWHHDLAWTTPRYRSEIHEGYPWDLLRQSWDSALQVVVSELRRQELADLLDIQRKDIHVIPNGVDKREFYKLEPQTVQFVAQLGLSEADPLLLLPVRLTPRKNIELALHVLYELRKDLPQAMLVVTGPQGAHNPANALYKQNLLDLRTKLNLQSAAHFLAEVSSEFLPDAVIADFYRLADALLFPSREEGFGIPIVEAAFSSMPVFCSDIPVLRELGGEDVTYFDPNADPDLVANLIISRLNSEATARWSRRAKHEYTWDSIYKLYIDPLIMEVVT